MNPRRLALALPIALVALALAPAAGGSAPEVPEGAFGESALDRDEPRVAARLLVDASRARPGSEVAVGVLFEMDRGWHIYWHNPGEAGLATRIDWSGVNAGPLRWPAPHVFSESDGLITTYGYVDEVLLSARARIPADATGSVEIAAEVNFLTCEVQCIPGSIRLARSLPVGEAGEAPRAVAALFEDYAKRVPQAAGEAGFQVEALFSQSAVRPGDRFRGVIALVHQGDLRPRPRAGKAAWVPGATPALEIEVLGSSRHPLSDAGLLIHFDAEALSGNAEAAPRLTGVVPLGDERGVEIDLSLPWAAEGAPVQALANPWLEPPPPNAGLHLWEAALLALVGGLILNLMPCVLPVLAIKVAGLAELAQKQRSEVIGHGVAYTAGILATMLVLGGLVAGLRAAGIQVGWGFQFQEPLFIAAISCVLVLFALNLFGVFEIFVDATRMVELEARASGLRKSFLEGLLAVLVATPCSAPFLGTAVGFAFAASIPTILTIFAAVGLGLASPYLLITLVPGWARFVPRSGAWMLKLRALLGFFLMGTVVWLLWVQGRSTGPDGMAGLLVFLLVVGFAAWIYGIAQGAPRLRVGVTTAALILLVGGTGALTLQTSASDAPETRADESALSWEPYAPAEIERALEGGRIVLVDFTADWCITCKLNESVVLESQSVVAEIERLNVALYKADWTRRDPEIRAELARHGRAGVPLYLVYSPDSPHAPNVLPELLSVDTLIDALRRAAPASDTASHQRREAA